MDKIAQHMPHPLANSKRSEMEKTHSQPSALAVCSPEEAIFQANMLLGCYRKADCEDPEVFIASVSAVLARYSAEVVATITHPATGIASKSKWLPTIAEIREACDLEQHKRDRWREQDQRVKDQLAQREEIARIRELQGETDRRKAFIAREMAALNADLKRDDKNADPSVLDVRGMPEGPVRSAIEKRLTEDLQSKRARYSTVPRLSDAALRSLGV